MWAAPRGKNGSAPRLIHARDGGMRNMKANKLNSFKTQCGKRNDTTRAEEPIDYTWRNRDTQNGICIDWVVIAK